MKLLFIFININLINLILTNNDEQEFYSKKVLHNLLHGKDINKFIEWNLPESILTKETKTIKCGATINAIRNDTVAISLCNNRIYQFHKDFSVTIYLKSKNRYSNNPNRLHLYDGYKIDLEKLEPKILKKNGFRQRTEFIMKYLPSNEPLTYRYWITLIRSSYGFELYARTMAADYHSWLCTSVKSNIVNGNEFHFEYEWNKKRQRIIPISAGTLFYQIVYHLDENIFKLYSTNDLYLDHHYTPTGYLCLSRKNDNYLRLIYYNQKCDYNDNQMDIKTGTLLQLLKDVQYGFTLFTKLALISTEKQLVLLIDRKILTNYHIDFKYHIYNLMDFFTCDEKNVVQLLINTNTNDDNENRRRRRRRQMKNLEF